MVRTSRILLFVTIGACAAPTIAACNADLDSGATSTQDTDAGRPDAASSTDAGDNGDDAARPPYDPNDEAMTCTAAPCVVQLVAGKSHFCARRTDGTARCWGSDGNGALGRGVGNATDGAAPAAVEDLTNVTQLSAAGSTTCARLADGTVRCWGGNEFGQLGLSKEPATSDTDPHPTSTPVLLDEPAARIDVGHRTACAVLGSGKVACWGSNETAQLARPGAGDAFVLGPADAVLDSLSVAQTAASAHTAFARTSEGNLFSWGALGGPQGNVAGRVGSVASQAAPYRVGPLAHVTSFAVSGWVEVVPDEVPGEPLPPPLPPRAHACAIADGEVHCWGNSYRGALCNGLPDARQIPWRAAMGVKEWPQQIAVADELTCVRMTDGTVRCCGEDGRGRLGTGSVGLYSSHFVAASAFKGHAVQVATSDSATCALVQGGTVECWGDNEHGELGQGKPDRAPHPSPLPVRF